MRGVPIAIAANRGKRRVDKKKAIKFEPKKFVPKICKVAYHNTEKALCAMSTLSKLRFLNRSCHSIKYLSKFS